MLTSSEIRLRYLEFFKKRGHSIIPSASLVPENDPSVLFNTAGMQPLVPYLLGEKHPAGTRLVDIQKCVRTNDIDEVGDNTHLTFFEMMGNWSLGDYFKKEAIEWSYELLTNKEEGFGLDPQRLYVTCFEGNEDAPKDTESESIWKSIFEKNNVTGERIYFMPTEKNWWSAGDNGPCGPDTEMFYDLTGTLSMGLTKEEYLKADDEQKVVEIWNDVFMEYVKKDGKVVGKLAKKNVDTGSGFERIVTVVQGKTNVYETDLFWPLLLPIMHLDPKSGPSSRIIADHIRSTVFMINDGVIPANTDRGYVLRRLIRRAYMHSRKIDATSDLLLSIADVVCGHESYKNIYKFETKKIREIISAEIDKFKVTLNEGLHEFHKLILKNNKILNGEIAYILFTSYGFPLELSIELAQTENEKIDDNISIIFEELMKKHQQLSRSGSEQKFKGGLGSTGEKEVRYHTATHLLRQALSDVFGEEVVQKGSNITAERLRFDFAHNEKMTDDQKKQVEDIVNAKIAAHLKVQKVLMKKEEALKTGAAHAFGDTYGEDVNIYYIGETLDSAYSKEFCGGPHVENTGVIGTFKILKEEAVSAGVRRIKAVVE